jgi:uncharacterized protein (UPF0276 family)
MELGVGVGWRRELALAIERYPRLGFVEVLAEGLDASRPLPEPLLALRERGVQVVLHSVGLSLGGAERPDARRLSGLARLAERLGAVLVSDHLCFVRAGGLESGHLLPLPRTHAALEVLAENVRLAQAALPVPLALENVATLFAWPAPEWDEAGFVTRALAATGAPLLLDVANLYADAENHGFDARAFLAALPPRGVAYAHLAGGVRHGGLYHDTHAHPVPEGALALAREAARLLHLPGVLLERDDAFPSEEALHAELDALAELHAHGRAEEARRAGG